MTLNLSFGSCGEISLTVQKEDPDGRKEERLEEDPDSDAG
jgi:hypothetical protein